MQMLSLHWQAHLKQGLLTLATCWKITRKDGVIQGFTDHDVSLAIDGVLYEASSGFTPSAIEMSQPISVDNMELEGILSSQSISEEDVLAGLYDAAEIEIGVVDHQNLGESILLLRRGSIGNITLKGQHFISELRGMTQPLSQTIGEVYAPTCRARLGDGRCGVDTSLFSRDASVTSVISRRVIHADGLVEEEGYFTGGEIYFLSGRNQQQRMEVKHYQPGRVECMLPLPFSVEVGDQFQIIAGCNKLLSTCRDRFNNLLNFRGEPHLPGVDSLVRPV